MRLDILITELRLSFGTKKQQQQLSIYYLSVIRAAMGQALNFHPDPGEELPILSIYRQSERKLKVLCD